MCSHRIDTVCFLSSNSMLLLFPFFLFIILSTVAARSETSLSKIPHSVQTPKSEVYYWGLFCHLILCSPLADCCFQLYDTHSLFAILFLRFAVVAVLHGVNLHCLQYHWYCENANCGNTVNVLQYSCPYIFINSDGCPTLLERFPASSIHAGKTFGNSLISNIP